MVLAATVLMGADNSGKYLTKSFDFKNFSGIEARGLVNVNVVKSDVYKVNLKVPDILEPYLRVKVQGACPVSPSSAPMMSSRYQTGVSS